MAWGQQYGFDQLMKIVNRPRDEQLAREREAARSDPRQLTLPYIPQTGGGIKASSPTKK